MSMRRSNRRRTPKAQPTPGNSLPSHTTPTPGQTSEFWSHEAFLEDENDESFDEKAHSDDGEDIIDSDFDAPEHGAQPEDDQVENATRMEERRAAHRARKSKLPVAPPTQTRPPRQKRKGRGEIGVNVDRSCLRKSTKVASAMAAKEREKRELNEEQKRRKKAMRDGKKAVVRVLTQRELMEEAGRTEVCNGRSLCELLRLEEEKKRVGVVKVRDGDVVRVRSVDGGVQTVSVPEGVDVGKVLFGDV